MRVREHARPGRPKKKCEAKTGRQTAPCFTRTFLKSKWWQLAGSPLATGLDPNPRNTPPPARRAPRGPSGRQLALMAALHGVQEGRVLLLLCSQPRRQLRVPVRQRRRRPLQHVANTPPSAGEIVTRAFLNDPRGGGQACSGKKKGCWLEKGWWLALPPPSTTDKIFSPEKKLLAGSQLLAGRATPPPGGGVPFASRKSLHLTFIHEPAFGEGKKQLARPTPPSYRPFLHSPREWRSKGRRGRKKSC